MKAALMAEQVHFGNDEPSNQLVRLMTGCRAFASPNITGITRTAGQHEHFNPINQVFREFQTDPPCAGYP
jgi:hypothetical protein